MSAAAHVVVVADTHLSVRTPGARRNWTAVVEYVTATRPDLVVHVGDISADGANLPDDLDYARDELARIDVPMHVLPGNHDLGDNPFGTRRRDSIDAGRLERYRSVFDADRWCLEVGAWRLIGFDAQLFESGLGDEVEQWTWLESQLSRGGRLAVFLHKPVPVLDQSHDDIRTPGRYVPPSSRRHLLHLFGRYAVRLVVSGHVHQQRSSQLDGTTHLWAPSTWAVLPESVQPALGDKRCGVVSLRLATDGRFAAAFVEPIGMCQQFLDARLLERRPPLRAV